MKNTNFSLLEQLGIPSYERKFEDINLNYVFSAEEIERYSIKKMTTLAIISDMNLPYNIPAYNHLNIILVSITDVKFYNYLDEMYQKITSYCGSLCIVVFEKNGALKLGNCNGVKFVNKTPYFSEIVFSRWIYEDTFEVALYTPATNRFHVISAPSANKARALYEEIAVRYTYYIAKDRTTDIYNRTDIGRGDRDDISAGSKFLWYLFRADSNNGYGSDELHNKYHLDSLTVVYDYNEYLKYLHNFTYTSRYDYLDNNDLKGMKSYISKVYSKDTVWNNWLFTIGD